MSNELLIDAYKEHIEKLDKKLEAIREIRRELDKCVIKMEAQGEEIEGVGADIWSELREFSEE